jgi:hypothetical protein
LVEVAIPADFALVYAFLADYLGNLAYALTARNFNPIAAMASERVIAGAEHIDAVGVITPDHVITPARWSIIWFAFSERDMNPQTIIARRIPRQLKAGILVILHRRGSQRCPGEAMPGKATIAKPPQVADKLPARWFAATVIRGMIMSLQPSNSYPQGNAPRKIEGRNPGAPSTDARHGK